MKANMDYSVEGMTAWLNEHKREERHKDIEKLSLRDALATIMLVNLIYRYASEVKKMSAEMRLSQFKRTSRRFEENLTQWKSTQIEVINKESIERIESALDELVEEQSINLFQLYISCKNEVDRIGRNNLSEISALSWRVVLLMRELESWLSRKVPSRYTGLSGLFEDLREIMEEYCGCEMIDLSRYKNTELCIAIFERALDNIEIEYVNKAS